MPMLSLILQTIYFLIEFSSLDWSILVALTIGTRLNCCFVKINWSNVIDFYNVVDIDAQRKPTQTKFAAILIEKNICCNSPKSDKFVIIEKFY